MNTRKIGLGAVLALASASATASNWYNMGPTSNGGTDFIDLSSIVVKSNYVTAWFLESGPEAQSFQTFTSGFPTNTPYKSSKEQNVFNCATRESARAHLAYYSEESGQGKYLGSIITPPSKYAFSSVIPDTQGELRLDTACKYLQKKKPAM